MRQVTVEASGPNTDGCDPDSCVDVLIEKCVFNTGDDCIAIKSGRDRDGHRVGLPSENIVIRGCTMKNGHGGITCGSEAAGDIRNVFAEDCLLNSPNLNMPLRFKTSPARGGAIENVSDSQVRHPARKQGWNRHDPQLRLESRWVPAAPHVPVLRNVEIADCSFANVPTALFVDGLSELVKISNIRIFDCRFENVTQANTLRFVDGLQLRGVTINGQPVKQPEPSRSIEYEMKYRTFGKLGWQISEISFGACARWRVGCAGRLRVGCHAPPRPGSRRQSHRYCCAIKFALAHPAMSTVIPGMRTLSQVEANTAVSDLPDLPASLLEKLRAHIWLRGNWHAGK